MWPTLIALASFLGGCTDEAAEAEKRYDLVKQTGTYGEICESGKALTAAYLRAGNEERYRWWHSISGIDCLNVTLHGYDAVPDSQTVDDLSGNVDAPVVEPTPAKPSTTPTPSSTRDPFCDEYSLSDAECSGGEDAPNTGAYEADNSSADE